MNISLEQEKEIIDLYVNQKIPMWKIAEIFNTYKKKISQILHKNNVKIDNILFYKRELPKEKELIATRYNNGESARKLMSEFNINERMFNDILLEFNIQKKSKKPNKNKISLTKEQLDKAIEIYNKFNSISFISECLNIRPDIIKRELKNNGIKINKSFNFKQNLKERWIFLYGNKIGEQKWNKYCNDISESSSGKNNAMYGKPSPKGAGNGWKGWYKNHYFRSLREVSYMIHLDKNNIKWESAEQKRFFIHYKNYDGRERTYRADFFLPELNKLIEIKPKKLQKSPLIKLKTAAATKFCKKNNLVYEILDFPINIEKIKEFLLKGLIKFDRNYKEKFLNYIKNIKSECFQT